MTHLFIAPLTGEALHQYDGDGHPCGQALCPLCGQPAIVINHYLGGYGDHKALRCQSDPAHWIPLLWDDAAKAYMAGHYHRHWHHGCEILPAAVLRASDQCGRDMVSDRFPVSVPSGRGGRDSVAHRSHLETIVRNQNA